MKEEEDQTDTKEDTTTAKKTSFAADVGNNSAGALKDENEEVDAAADALADLMMKDVIEATGQTEEQTKKKKKGGKGGLFGSLKAASKFRKSLQKNKDTIGGDDHKKATQLGRIGENSTREGGPEGGGVKNPSLAVLGNMGSGKGEFEFMKDARLRISSLTPSLVVTCTQARPCGRRA